MKWAAWIRAYAAHADPATATTNLVALVIASNGPFYPIYVLALIGWDRSGAWLTMLATPCFALVPMVSRRHLVAGRAALPFVGIANTIWCTILLGSESGVALFLLPCIVLTALQFRHDERWAMLLLLGSAIAAQIGLAEFPPIGLMHLHTDQAAALARLNKISVATLMGFLALKLATLPRPSSTR